MYKLQYNYADVVVKKRKNPGPYIGTIIIIIMHIYTYDMYIL